MTKLTRGEPGEPLPDISGPVVNLEDLKVHQDYRRTFAEMTAVLREAHRKRNEESVAMKVAEDVFDLVLSEEYATADSVAFHLLHECASFLKNVVNVDSQALNDIVNQS